MFKTTVMSDFKRRAVLSDRLLEFDFRNVYSSQSDKYFVIVTDGPVEIGKFELVSNPYGKWRIPDPAPSWVKLVEDQIIDMLRNPYNEQHTYVLRQSADGDSRSPG
jgi:hypothetical protein